MDKWVPYKIYYETRAQNLSDDLSRSGSDKVHTRTLGRLWKLPVSYYVNQSGNPDNVRGPTEVRIVQKLPEKIFQVVPICSLMIPEGSIC